MRKLPSPSQIDDKDLAAVRAQAEPLLHRLQARAEKTDDPTMQHLRNASPKDVQIEALSAQGCSKQTYCVEIGDYKAILSVNTPRVWSQRMRSTYDNRLAFRRHLRSYGIPIPGKIGKPFQLDGVVGSCELTEFVGGYKKARGDSFSDEELQSIGDMLGRMHEAGDFHPRPTFRAMASYMYDNVKKAGRYIPDMPHGYTHGDFSHGNVLFDPETHKIAGVIDFEFARDMRYVDEIAYSIRCYASDIRPNGGNTSISVNPHKKAMLLEAYEARRPLSPEERTELERVMPKQLAIEARYWDGKYCDAAPKPQPNEPPTFDWQPSSNDHAKRLASEPPRERFR